MFSNFYYNIKYGIGNLFLWFPIIWRDRPWDQAYLFRMLAFKLSLMEDLFQKYGHLVSSKSNAKKIRICKNLIKRLEKEDYMFMKEYERLFKIKPKLARDFHDKIIEEDLELFTKIFKNNVLGWWD